MIRERIRNLWSEVYVRWYDFRLRSRWQLYRFYSFIRHQISRLKRALLPQPAAPKRKYEFYWCPVCNGGDPMNERYGSYSGYRTIMKDWGSVDAYYEHLRTREYAEAEDEVTDEFLYDFSYIFPDNEKSDYDTVLFLLCPNCGTIIAEDEYPDYVRGYTDWYDL